MPAVRVDGRVPGRVVRNLKNTQIITVSWTGDMPEQTTQDTSVVKLTEVQLHLPGNVCRERWCGQGSKEKVGCPSGDVYHRQKMTGGEHCMYWKEQRQGQPGIGLVIEDEG